MDSISSNTVGGDLAGRDLIKNTTLLNPRTRTGNLDQLYEKYKSEKATNSEFRKFIEELDYYNSQVDGEKIIGLDAKLEAGNRSSFKWYAKTVKERFHKKLLKTSQFSSVAQDINIYLLAAVRSYFMTEIYPRICSNEDPNVINLLVNERIVEPLMDELGENLLSLTHDDIHGMIYFLTGNCHIKWCEDVDISPSV